MRCSCQNCGTYMVHAESLSLGCVCPECGARCRACLGTDTVVSRETLRRLKDDPALAGRLFHGDADDADGAGGEPPQRPLPVSGDEEYRD